MSELTDQIMSGGPRAKAPSDQELSGGPKGKIADQSKTLITREEDEMWARDYPRLAHLATEVRMSVGSLDGGPWSIDTNDGFVSVPYRDGNNHMQWQRFRVTERIET